jgi:hypothetical protein
MNCMKGSPAANLSGADNHATQAQATYSTIKEKDVETSKE